MSKTHKKFPLIFAVFTHILFAISVAAQDFEVKIKIPLPNQSLVRVEINFPSSETGKTFSFPQSYADAEGLDLRIQNLTIKNNKNQEIRIAKSPGGEFQTAEDFSTA